MTTTWQLKCWNSTHIHTNSVLYYLWRLALLFIPRPEHSRPENPKAKKFGLNAKAKDFKVPIDRKVGLAQTNCVAWGCSCPKRGLAPQFPAHVYCGQSNGRPSQLLLSTCTKSRPTMVRPMLSDRCLSCPIWDVGDVAKRLDGSRCHFVGR